MFTWISKLSLRRIITSNRWIPEVDGFRFLAIFIVIAAHIYVQCQLPASHGIFSSLFRRAFSDGKLGVYLFFTISGFILALPFARQHLSRAAEVNLSKYFMRRVTRLEPPYILAMLLRFPLLVLYKHLSLLKTTAHLVASLFYVHSLIYNQYSTINPPAWSLEIEIQFYIVAPLLAGVFLIRSAAIRKTLLAAAILIAAILADTAIPSGGRASLTLLSYSQYFLAGILLCEIYLSRNHLHLPAFAWDAIGIAALLWILFSTDSFHRTMLPFATILLYMAGFYGRSVRGFFSLPAISIIGGMCYSIYLTHTAVLTGVQLALSRLPIQALPAGVVTAIIFALCFSLVLVVGTTFFVLIERPCMDPSWPHRLAQKFAEMQRGDMTSDHLSDSP